MNNFSHHQPGAAIMTALAAERKILATHSLSDISIYQCGMGCESAYGKASGLPAGTMVGSIGVSGGLAPDLAPGSVIVADTVYTQCRQSVCPQDLYYPDAQLTALLEMALRGQGIDYRRGPVLCVDRPMLTPAAKARAHYRTGALAVDMESAGVAEAARRKGLPFFCLRVICDPAWRGVAPELMKGVDDRGNSRPFHLAAAVGRRPRLFFSLLRMAGDFYQAAASMRRTWKVIQPALHDLARSAARSPDSYGQGL